MTTNLLLQVLILNSITAACWKNNREGNLLSTLKEAAGAGTLGYTHLIHFGRCQGTHTAQLPPCSTGSKGKPGTVTQLTELLV